MCDSCKYDIVSEPFERCLVCLLPSADSNLCRSCAGAHSIVDAWCVAARSDSLKTLLDRYKFVSARAAGGVATTLLDARLPILPDDIVITTVPTAATNQRSRGFDHTAHIARKLARSRGLTYLSTLRRLDNTTQHFRARAERLKLSADSFEIIGKPPLKLLLIDDIYTTGATVRACVGALKSAGVSEVYVAIIARQTLDEAPHL